LQVKDALAVGVIHPVIYVSKKFDSCVGMASWLAFVGLGVKEGTFNDWQFGEDESLIDIENLLTGRGRLTSAASQIKGKNIDRRLIARDCSPKEST
jgi:hypothetical protein